MTTPSVGSAPVTRFMLWSIALVLGLAAPARILAADAEDKGTLFGSVAVPAGVSASGVQDQIVATFLGRQWEIKSKTDGQVVGYLKHRANEATVTFVYDSTKVEIYCVGYKIDKQTGVRLKPEQPAGWLKFLQHDLTINLSRLVPQK